MRVIGVRIGLVAAVIAPLVVLVTPAAHASVTINVPASQPTIQAGIDAASAGDTVVVAPGTYFEHIDFKGKAIEVRSSAGPATTIIDGGGTATVVLFMSGEPRTAILRGFTITHGFIGPRPTVTLAGAGISMYQSSATVVGNVVTGNDAGQQPGGGVGAAAGSPLIRDNVIRNNHSNLGAGGITAGTSDAEIINNVIEDNTAPQGGGMVLYAGTPRVRDNVIRRNHAGSPGGGGVFISSSYAKFAGNIVVDNMSDSVAGGVYVEDGWGSGAPYLLNNTIVDNQAPSGSAVAILSATATIVNNILAGPSATSSLWCPAGAGSTVNLSHNDVYNATPTPYAGCTDPTGTNGNVSADPSLSASYAPQPGSQVLDAGDNAAVSLPATDFFGNPRVTDGNGDGVAVVDMGAVESAAVAASGERYHPLTPARILDTRTTVKLGAASTLAVQITGQGGVPATGVSAVVLNITVTQPSTESFLTAWPAGVSRPTASNLNFLPGQTVPNLVVVRVGAGGQVDLYNNAGATHVVADVAGWYGGTTEGARYTAVTPARILDTRTGAKVGPGATVAVQVTGQGGVPATGVIAVVLNITATQPTTESFLTAWPAGIARPTASNLNFLAGQTVPNLVVVKVGAGGQVNLYNNAGSTHVVADVAGWYGADGAPGGAGFSSTTPARILDTRAGAKLGAGATLAVQVTGQGGVPATGVTSVVLNITATQPTTESFLTAWPAGVARPTASNLNYLPGQTVPNLVVVKVGAGGKVNLYNNAGATHVVVDVAGWYSG